MSKNTKDKLIAVATNLFAERGFYGVSIADVSERLGITKQALLYHFGSKAKLYDAVLRHIADDTMKQFEAFKREANSLEDLLMLQFDDVMQDNDGMRVVIRELMDNHQRAKSVQDWVMKPYLDAVTDWIAGLETMQDRSRAECFALFYQIQGASLYFMMSVPTLENMYTGLGYQKIRQSYSGMLREIISNFD